MVIKKVLMMVVLFFVSLCFVINANAKTNDEFQRLKQAYPDTIHDVASKYIAWKDGSRMLISGSFSFIDKLAAHIYDIDKSLGSVSKDDLQHDRYELVFRKMYGNSASEVKKNLVTVYWMSNVFGKRYPLNVTTVNGVDQKIRRISAALEKLPPTYYKYLERPAGCFYWRKVAGQSYLSTHSFGIAIDINSSYSNYWLWDLRKSRRPLSELTYQNRIPMEIVEIFEKEGFFWGGRWPYYYDTMHFEYRPEFFVG